MTSRARDGTDPEVAPAADFSQHCRSVVRQVLDRHQWTLAPYEVLVQEVLSCIEAGVVAKPWPATINIYCQYLYRACTGAEGADRQERGFLELYRYLYELSFREVQDMPTDLREEAVNETLFRIWQKLDHYRKPSAFLSNAAYELLNVIRPWWSRQRMAASLDTIAEQPISDSESDITARLIDQEMQETVKRCFDDTLRRNPRARQQLEAVWLKFILQLDDTTISRYIGKPIATIHVLRSRGLQHLRRDPSWQQIARELQINA
jgi:DNA-directed RNA polymerase specialized sigma24 family protein